MTAKCFETDYCERTNLDKKKTGTMVSFEVPIAHTGTKA